MSKYTATFEFGTDADLAEVEEWIEKLRVAFPEEVAIKLRMEPLILDPAELKDSHAGNVIKFTSTRYGTVQGTLENVYPTSDGAGRVVIVDGRAYNLTYEVVTLSEW